MSAAPALTRQRRAPASRRRATVEALALALLLLITQQWGLSHALQHRVAGGAAIAVADRPAASGADSGTAADLAADGGADSVCATCLTLAGLGALALPPLATWAAVPLPAAAPADRIARSWHRTAAAPFQARAPPVLS